VGDNQTGELGDGTTNPRMTPAIVPGLSKVKQLSNGGLLNICALQHDGRVFSWGRNDGGEVGDGTTAERHSPSPVAVLSKDVATIRDPRGAPSAARRAA
jgi:alpha-tubulin suppressor-like RCC1 family protein